MAKDTYFSLYFDKSNPKDPKDCKQKDPGNTIDAPPFSSMQKFFDLLDGGALTTIGYIYRGQIDPNAEVASTTATSRQCIIMYVGGTAYKICM